MLEKSEIQPIDPKLQARATAIAAVKEQIVTVIFILSGWSGLDNE